jgi:hypothetical protein
MFSIWVDQAHGPIALQTATDLPTPFLRSAPYRTTVIPAVGQHMGLRIRHRLKGLDLVSGHLDLALKDHAFLLADRFLTIQLTRQRTALTPYRAKTSSQVKTASFLQSHWVGKMEPSLTLEHKIRWAGSFSSTFSPPF